MFGDACFQPRTRTSFLFQIRCFVARKLSSRAVGTTNHVRPAAGAARESFAYAGADARDRPGNSVRVVRSDGGWRRVNSLPTVRTNPGASLF